ncbi:DNA-formamidopyrimidine glycosylase family protein, partial [Enterococcus faecalis]|uniref:DNA-formamidopyrimidine glycosylase family protein n=1 Tax=Enterococcus faecalis TaxID=1351 RepID=UPI003D6A3F47
REVERLRRGLENLVVGKTIQEVIVFWARIIESREVDVFQGQLSGQTIEGIQRRGKFLIFKLCDNDIISHLRMEGKYEFH